jgi:WD40 repeat protein
MKKINVIKICIDILKAHSSDITKLLWLDKEQMLVTGGKDKSIKVFI